MATSNFNIQAFRSQISKGFIRNSNFLTTFSLPLGFNQNMTGDASQELKATQRVVQFYVESSSVPGIGLATDEIRRYGHGNVTLKPYAPIFDTVDMLVRCDAEGKVYDFFQTWIKMIINTDTRISAADAVGFNGAGAFEVNYKVFYQSQCDMVTYDDEGNESIHTTLRNAFPIYMGPIAMNWSDGANIAKFPIKVTFEQWYQNREFAGTTTKAQTPLYDILP